MKEEAFEMESAKQASNCDEHDLLPKNVSEFNFYQLVELLNKLQPFDSEEEAWERECKLVFCANPSLGFSPADVHDLDRLPTGNLIMQTNFFGLSGAQSPLPGFIVEQLLNEAPGSFRQPFFDFFNNRLINLVYRVWRKYRYYVRFQPNAKDEFSTKLFALIGLGTPELRENSPVNWGKMLACSGMLAGHSRSPQVVARVVAHAFELKDVVVRQWTRRVVPLAPEQQTQLGCMNSQLGVTSLLGESIADRQGKFTLCLQQLSLARFYDFLPSGKDYSALCQLMTFILREPMAYDLELTLKEQEVPSFTLGGGTNAALGWSTFLGNAQQEKSVLIQVRQ